MKFKRFPNSMAFERADVQQTDGTYNLRNIYITGLEETTVIYEDARIVNHCCSCCAPLIEACGEEVDLKGRQVQLHTSPSISDTHVPRFVRVKIDNPQPGVPEIPPSSEDPDGTPAIPPAPSTPFDGQYWDLVGVEIPAVMCGEMILGQSYGGCFPFTDFQVELFDHDGNSVGMSTHIAIGFFFNCLPCHAEFDAMDHSVDPGCYRGLSIYLTTDPEGPEDDYFSVPIFMSQHRVEGIFKECQSGVGALSGENGIPDTVAPFDHMYFGSFGPWMTGPWVGNPPITTAFDPELFLPGVEDNDILMDRQITVFCSPATEATGNLCGYNYWPDPVIPPEEPPEDPTEDPEPPYPPLPPHLPPKDPPNQPPGEDPDPDPEPPDEDPWNAYRTRKCGTTSVNPPNNGPNVRSTDENGFPLSLLGKVIIIDGQCYEVTPIHVMGGVFYTGEIYTVCSECKTKNEWIPLTPCPGIEPDVDPLYINAFTYITNYSNKVMTHGPTGKCYTADVTAERLTEEPPHLISVSGTPPTCELCGQCCIDQCTASDADPVLYSMVHRSTAKVSMTVTVTNITTTINGKHDGADAATIKGWKHVSKTVTTYTTGTCINQGCAVSFSCPDAETTTAQYSYDEDGNQTEEYTYTEPGNIRPVRTVTGEYQTPKSRTWAIGIYAGGTEYYMPAGHMTGDHATSPCGGESGTSEFGSSSYQHYGDYDPDTFEPIPPYTGVTEGGYEEIQWTVSGITDNDGCNCGCHALEADDGGI